MPPKGSSTGPIAEVTRQDLLTILPVEVRAYVREAIAEQPIIDEVVDTWGKIYHTLVWLAAAKDDPGLNESLGANGRPIYIVPAYTLSEGGNELAGLIFGIQSIFDRDKNRVAGGVFFQDEAYQKYIVNGETKPLLQHFLLKFKDHRKATGFDPQTFDPAALLAQCKASTATMNFHPDTATFVGKALTLIRALWGAGFKAKLQKINNWLNDGGEPGSVSWLNTQFLIDTLDVAGLFEGNDSVAKKRLNSATLAFSLDREILGFIYDRFVDLDNSTLKSDGLERIIAILTSQLQPADSTAWDQLLTATYGAVAIKIFNQTKTLVDQANQILV